MGRYNLHVGADGAEQLPSGWRDEIVCHTMRKNRDGSITVIALVNVYDGKGNCYSNEHTMKLSKKRR